jgi:unsaturated rhamnogalacturonyl hydrolase
MGLVDVLDYLPPTHRDRPELLSIFRDLAAAVAKVQDPATGLWYQVLDQSDRAGNYHEASASSMFVYAIAKGVRRGYLDRTMLPVATRGYQGILDHLISIDPDGLVSIHGVCQVAGLSGKDNRDGSYEYYIHEPVVSNDYKGIGAFILASEELGR